MDELRELIGISFKELETRLRQEMAERFTEALAALLGLIDEHLFIERDPKRYEVVDQRKRSIETVLGATLEFKRRYYYDQQERRHVFLLDEVLGLQAKVEASPALMEMALWQAVNSPSYRQASASLENMHGRPVLSHETLRKYVLQVGQEAATIEEQARQAADGKRKVDVLFLEVDGLSHSLQHDKKDRVEEKILISHEGWEKRHPGSSEKRLKKLSLFSSHDEDEFWEEASRHVMSRYEIDEKTVVVINGDRASWIRKGVNYFPNALYQVDRFHLNRDLRRIFGRKSECLKDLYAALDEDVTGAAFLSCLVEKGSELASKKDKDQLDSLINDLSEVAEATCDYRLRLKTLGNDVTGYEPMGAAEAQMDRIGDRTKRRGQSWSRQGLKSIMQLICWKYEGLFAAVLDRVKQPDCGKLAEFEQITKEAMHAVASKHLAVKQARVPMLNAGLHQSAGLSNLMHRLIANTSC